MRPLRFAAIVTSAVLVTGVVAPPLVSPLPAPAAASATTGRGDEPSVPGRPLADHARGGLPAASASAPALAPPVWPAAADAVVNLAAVPPGESAVAVARSAVSVGPADADSGSVGSVRARVLDHAAMAATGGQPLGLVLTRADGGRTGGRARIRIDYSAFATAYGGSYGRRLRLVRLPACALTTPRLAACQLPTVLGAVNDPVTRTITGVVPVDPAGALPSLVTLAAGSSSPAGDYRATDLAPTGAWSVAPGSGDFTYSVPIQLPAPPYGSAPKLSLNYDSQSVDGLTSATNNQAGPAGMGWSLSGSYVERHYRLCSDDGGAPSDGDLCWDSPASPAGTNPGDADYTIVLNGVSSELIQDPSDSTIFHMVDDRGWRIQHLTGLTGNGDNDGEFWVVTTPDGTHNWFGYGARFTDHVPTNSVQTAPVFGNNPGEPCYGSSPCTQAYRWNLDLVQDPNEVDSSYLYVKNTNGYHSTMGSPVERTYVYESHLVEIDYGYAQGLAGANFTDAVTTSTWYRCVGAMAQTDLLHNSPATCSLPMTATNFPDVPVDLACPGNDPDSCSAHAWGPVFFTETMLKSIYVSTISASGTWTRVIQYALKHSLHNPAGGVGPYLQLDYLQREATGGTGGAVTLPTIAFSYTDLDNTLAGTGLDFGRLTGVTTDLGAQVTVAYGTPDACSPTAPPDPATNTKDCYRHQYTPQGGTQTWAWYKKQLVTSVTVDPRVGVGAGNDGDPKQITTYSYATNKAAWRFPADPTQKRDNESWTEWRGYQRATVTTGSGAAKNSTVYYQYQGIDGDRKVVDADPANPADYKSVSVTDSNGTAYTDSSFLGDRPLEEVAQDGAGADQIHRFHQYWSDDIGPYPGLPDARFIRENRTTTRMRLSTSSATDSTWREHVVVTNFDTAQPATSDFGLPVSVYDQGDTSVPGDDTCTTYGYAFDTAPVVNSTLGQDEWYALDDDLRQFGSACPGTPAAQFSRVVTLYDGAASESVNAPYSGNPTKVITYSGPSTMVTTTATYDGGGRRVSTTDGNGNTATTSYSPAANWPSTGVAVTVPPPDPTGVTGSPTGLTTTTVSSPTNGQPLRVTDPNGNVTTIQYDSVGRIVNLWNPTEPTSGVASATFTYTIPTATTNGVPTVVSGPARTRSAMLQSLSGPLYLASYEYLDGLGRTRENQTPATDGSAGRDVISTRYDDAGHATVTSNAYFNSGSPGSGMVNPALSTLPSAAQLSVDWSGRTTESKILALGVAQTRGDVHTAYPGADYHAVTDPDGHVTDSYTDVSGQVTSIVQHTPNLSPATITTTYTYNHTGQLTSITDAAGHVSSYTYDWLNQVLSATDPDSGTTTQTHDNNGNIVTSTDNKGQLITTVYDAIDRPTARWNGTVGANKLIYYSYDSAPGGKGKLASSTSFNNGGSSYKTLVDGYDADGRQTGTTVSIPPGEGLLAGGYDTTYGYDRAGHQTTITYPAVGTGAAALPAETVTTGYAATGLPTTVTSPLATYVSATTYANYGPLTSRTYGSATAHTATRSYTWSQAVGDLTGTTATITNGGTPTTVQNAAYTRDNAGNLLEIASVSSGQQQCFGYDSLNRLTTAYTTTTATVASCQGAAPNHTGGTSPYDLVYAYDQLGDMTSVVDTIAAVTSTYSFTDAAHLHAVTDVLLNGGPSGHYTYSYNQNGAQVGRTVAGVFSASTWTVMHQLSTFTTGAATTTFYYDGAGARLLRKTGSDATLYLPGQELRLVGSVVTPTRYYGQDDSQVAMRVGGSGTGSVSWTMADPQRSAEFTIDAGTGAYLRQRYLPFGAQRGTQGPAPGTDTSFLGHPQDVTTSLIADGARYYDPTTARFTSPDPVTTPGNPQNLNAYSYAINNPETLSDPSGLLASCGITIDDSGVCGSQLKSKDPATAKAARDRLNEYEARQARSSTCPNGICTIHQVCLTSWECKWAPHRKPGNSPNRPVHAKILVYGTPTTATSMPLDDELVTAYGVPYWEESCLLYADGGSACKIVDSGVDLRVSIAPRPYSGPRPRSGLSGQVAVSASACVGICLTFTKANDGWSLSINGIGLGISAGPNVASVPGARQGKDSFELCVSGTVMGVCGGAGATTDGGIYVTGGVGVGLGGTLTGTGPNITLMQGH